ncbi:MAG TPA: APC family permease, partial [Gemmatimonadaceae bacterium]|nr:APC family permease [Gemmatimonadaceae bacterium]
CAVAMALIVLCFAGAGSRVSLSGGTYAYAGVAFGPYIGFVVAMSLWFGSQVLASAAVAAVFVDTLAALNPRFGEPAVRAAILIFVYSLLAAINIRGVKTGSRVVQTVTAAKLTPLILLIAVGLFAIEAQHLAWPGMPSKDELARTSIILIFAFLGIESALTPSGEVRNPARTVPRAIFTSLIVVTIIYMGIQIVSLGVLGPDLATNTKAPLAETARRLLGSGGHLLVLVGAAVSTFGYVAGDMLAAPRGIYALGRDRLLPSVIASVHPTYRTPYVAILIHAVLCLGFALSGSFQQLVVLAVIATLIVYLICCLAAIQLQRRNIRDEGAVPFQVPGGPVIPIIASAIVIWLMTASTRQEFLAMGAMLVAETALFLLMRVRRAPDPTTA